MSSRQAQLFGLLDYLVLANQHLVQQSRDTLTCVFRTTKRFSYLTEILSGLGWTKISGFLQRIERRISEESQRYRSYSTSLDRFALSHLSHRTNKTESLQEKFILKPDFHLLNVTFQLLFKSVKKEMLKVYTKRRVPVLSPTSQASQTPTKSQRTQKW